MHKLKTFLLGVTIVVLGLLTFITMASIITGCRQPHFTGDQQQDETEAVDATKWIHISPEEMREPLESGVYHVGTYVERPGCGFAYGPAGMDVWELWSQDGKRYLTQQGTPAVVSAVATAMPGHPNTYVHRAHHFSGGCIFKYVTQITLRKIGPMQFQGEWEQLVDAVEFEGGGGCSISGSVCGYLMKVAGYEYDR